MKEPVYLVDGNAYIHRAYHAVAPLSNKNGLPTNAVFGFTNILLRVIREKSPAFLAVAFDLKGPTFRHELSASYKGNRPPMAEDLVVQVPYIKRIVQGYKIMTLEKSGFEADDLIAAASRLFSAAGIPVVIVSGDKDLLQLVSEQVTVWEPMQDRIMDPAAVSAKYQVPPERLLDLFALVGDSSDNITGVPGVGPKTATKLLQEFGSLDLLYRNLDRVESAKLKEKLAANQGQAFLARKLVALRDDVDIPVDIQAYRRIAPDLEVLKNLFSELEFSRLLKSELPTDSFGHQGFHLVVTASELAAVLRELGPAPLLVVDTETTSLDPLSAELVGISLCASETSAWYIPLGHRKDGTLVAGQLAKAEVLEALRPLLEEEGRPKLGHNLKFDYAVLRHHGIRLAGPLYDTMIASYLLDPSRRSHKLDILCEEFLERRPITFEEVTGKGENGEGFAGVGLEEARDYSCEDVLAAFLLWQKFQPQLVELDLWDLFREVETGLVPILAAMEEAGIKVDAGLLREISADFERQLEQLDREIFSLAGERFNLNSPQQLAEILFEKLKLPRGRKTKSGYSTDIKVLEKLARNHELPGLLISRRNLTKLKSTYSDKLLTQIHPATGRIHTSFNQTVTATGRLSSSNPNLQNIPIRSPEGQRIRQAFIPEAGHLFLAADYSQIDLRVLAHYSRDEALLTAFRSGKDIHGQTAALIFQVNPALITAEMRRVAKSINFGIVYGMSAFGLAEQLNLSRKEAETFISRYFAHYHGVKTFMTDIVEQARRDGYVTTLLKRRRLLPEINSGNRIRREFAERTAINTPIQGTAADIIKIAAIRVEQRLRAQNLKAMMLLQIHDELVFEVPAAEVEALTILVREAMETVLELAVPLTVNISTGPNLAAT